MDLKQLLETTPESMAQVQHDALKTHVLFKLDAVRQLISKEGYLKVDAYTFLSPAGGGYGMDNACINFAPDGVDEPMDIDDAMGRLQTLKTIIQGTAK